MNFPAYYEVTKFKFQEFFGLREPSALEELVEIPTSVSDQVAEVSEQLATSSNPEIQKHQIPDLEFDVAPTDNRLIIPRIDKNIPVVRVSSQSLIKRDWGALESEIQGALRNGVVHYPGTAVPGQSGNVAITGHSSYFPWDPGRFKDEFALLHELILGDKIMVFWDQKRYFYQVEDIEIVLPDDVKVLKQTPDNQLTLITCTPIGTNLKRLIIKAKQIEQADITTAGSRVVR